MSNSKVRDLLRKAFRFGESHWIHADSELIANHKKADVILQEFAALLDEGSALEKGTCIAFFEYVTENKGKFGSMPLSMIYDEWRDKVEVLREHLSEGMAQAQRGEFSNLTPEDVEQQLNAHTGEKP